MGPFSAEITAIMGKERLSEPQGQKLIIVWVTVLVAIIVMLVLVVMTTISVFVIKYMYKRKHRYTEKFIMDNLRFI